MPCAAVARGGRVTLTFPASPPMDFTPVHAKSHRPPFNDAIDNNPCGKGIVSVANAVNVAAHNCCLPHLKAKLGQSAVEAPYTFAA